ncbi:hypothetical protein A2Y83_01235 [Candidatus Falkowbacteria bacterium RBG_13_39_14]|uniref:Uncharacterized protein n=1 Tax=Candidatus Falkowbacteria bacterium RBG_13_39_14 TaxID=1797985 RepID=A0A1F5S4W0_9BACT|nr:MAG: hypothetical protein A2Y83_01235 [Candidatus Falkowbacteria bacterium RBG_13_39_14]
MQTAGGSRFDLIRFFVIFLAWIIGAWAIVYNVNKIEREGLFMFNEKLDFERQEQKINDAGIEGNGEEINSEEAE